MVPGFGFDPHAKATFLRNLDKTIFRSDGTFQHQRPVAFVEPLTAFLDPYVRRCRGEMGGRIEQQGTACGVGCDGQLLGIGKGGDLASFGQAAHQVMSNITYLGVRDSSSRSNCILPAMRSPTVSGKEVAAAS